MNLCLFEQVENLQNFKFLRIFLSGLSLSLQRSLISLLLDAMPSLFGQQRDLAVDIALHVVSFGSLSLQARPIHFGKELCGLEFAFLNADLRHRVIIQVDRIFVIILTILTVTLMTVMLGRV